MTYTAVQMQSLLVGLSRQLAALYGRELKQAGIEISALGNSSPDEEVALRINEAYARASAQAIELVRMFGQIPDLAGDPAWQSLQANYLDSFENIVERIHDDGRLHVDKLSDVLGILDQATAIKLPGTAGTIGEMVGITGGAIQTALDVGDLIIAARDGDYSTMATVLTMGVVGTLIDATLGRFPYLGPLLTATGIVGLVEDAFEDSASAGFQRIFGDSEMRYMVERCYQLYGQGFQQFDGTELAALFGTLETTKCSELPGNQTSSVAAVETTVCTAMRSQTSWAVVPAMTCWMGTAAMMCWRVGTTTMNCGVAPAMTDCTVAAGWTPMISKMRILPKAPPATSS